MLPTPTDPAGTFVGEVHVVVEGSGPPVALVHGVPGSVRDFRYLAPALVDAGFTAVRIDLPGFGKTPARAFPSTRATSYAGFVRGVMRALSFPRFVVAGHSFGGGIAMLCAAQFPDDVVAYVAMNSIGPRRHRGFVVPPSLYRAYGIALALPIPALAAFAQKTYAARGLRSENGLDVEVLRHHARLIGTFDFADMRAAARMVRAPALVVSADDDPLVEPASSFALARALAHAPFHTHLHSKHGGHFTQKHEAYAIARWLAVVAAR